VSDPDAGPVIRPGLASVRNLSRPAADQVAAGRPYRDLEDFAVRTHLPAAALEALATAGAFGCFGLSRRAALWAAGAAGSLREGQLPGTTTGLDAQLPAMTPPEQTLADLWATSTYVAAAALRALRALPSSPGVSVPSRDFR
jgi:error-prone DNA polymerase